MTREEALESGIKRALFVWGGHDDVETVGGFVEQFLQGSGPPIDPSELEGFAVGLQLVAVEVAEVARKRREANAQPSPVLNVVHDEGDEPDTGPGEAWPDVETATSDAPESKPDGEAFTYERVEVAGPAGDPIWVYERRPVSMSKAATSDAPELT